MLMYRNHCYIILPKWSCIGLTVILYYRNAHVWDSLLYYTTEMLMYRTHYYIADTKGQNISLGAEMDNTSSYTSQSDEDMYIKLREVCAGADHL